MEPVPQSQASSGVLLIKMLTGHFYREVRHQHQNWFSTPMDVPYVQNARYASTAAMLASRTSRYTHMGSKICRKTIAKRDKDSKKKNSSILNFFKRPKAVPVSSEVIPTTTGEDQSEK